MEKVGVNTFVTRQIKGSGKTYSDKLTFNEIALDAQSQMAKKSYDDGYRDGVRIVQASKKNIKHFHCPFVKINSNTQLISRVVKRQDNEESYIQTRAVTGKQLEAEKVEYILYRHDILAEIKENSTKDPKSPYGMSKLIFEDILKQVAEKHNLKTVIFRYFKLLLFVV